MSLQVIGNEQTGAPSCDKSKGPNSPENPPNPVRSAQPVTDRSRLVSDAAELLYLRAASKQEAHLSLPCDINFPPQPNHFKACQVVDSVVDLSRPNTHVFFHQKISSFALKGHYGQPQLKLGPRMPRGMGPSMD